jgi:chromosome segregation ATPase
LRQTSPQLLSLIPEVSGECNAMDLEAGTLNETVDNFSDSFLNKLKDLIFQNEAYSEIKEVIDQINFNADGKPDLRKIGMDGNKELNLITLAQLLILNQDKDFEKSALYKDLTDFLVNYQDELLSLVHQSLRTLDLINGNFAEEIAKLDGTEHESKYRVNKFRLAFIPLVDHEKLIREKDAELADKSNLINHHEKTISDYKSENLRLNQYIQELLKDKEKIKSLEFQLENAHLDLKSQKQKFNEDLENLKQHYEKLLHNAKSERAAMIHDYEEELEKLKSHLKDEMQSNQKALEALKAKNDKETLELRSTYDLRIRELENFLSQHRKERELEKRAFEKENELLRQQLDSQNKANDYNKKRISELELLLLDAEKENEHLKEIYEEEVLDLKKKHEVYLNQLREESKSNIDEIESKLLIEKSNTKKVVFERDSHIKELKDALNKIHNLEEDLKYLNLTLEKKVHYMEKQIKEAVALKEKIEVELENEHMRYMELNTENISLREKRNELNMRIVELEELLKTRQLEEDKRASALNNIINDLKRAKEVADKKYQALENTLAEEKTKTNSTILFLEKRITDSNEQLEELRNVSHAYQDRIAELEQEIFELKNCVNRLEAQKLMLNQTIIDINSQLNITLNSSKNSKNEEQRKLTELSSQINNFPKIKEMLNNRIKDLEDQLAREKNDFLDYQKDSENRLHLLQIQLGELNNKNITLEHQLESVNSELDNERLRNQRKINDLTLSLQEMIKLKDKNQADFIEEKTKLNKTIIELERKIKELNLQFDDHSNKSDFNYKRLKELELIMDEERKKYENYVLDSEKRIIDLNSKISQLQLSNQDLQKQNYTLEHDLADEKSKIKVFIFEKENLVKNFKEKEGTLFRQIDDLRTANLEYEKSISEISNKVKDSSRIKEKLEHRLAELEEMLKNEREKNLNGCQSHERLIRDLQAKSEEALRIREALEKENSETKAKYKVISVERDSLLERKNMLEEANEEFIIEVEELRKFRENYQALKKVNDKVSAQAESLGSRIKQLEDELSREKLKYNSTISNLNSKLNDLSQENQQLHQYKDQLENEVADSRNTIKHLQMELDLLQSKLDEQYLELNNLKEANKNNANLMKNIQILNLQIEELNSRIKLLEIELAVKSKKLDEAAYINKNYKDKVDEQQKKIEQLNEIIISLEEQLSQKPILVKAEPKRELNRDYKNIDFSFEDYNDLLLNRKNWPIMEPWLAPMRQKNTGTLKLNLLYKATRDGFSHTAFKDRCVGKSNTLVVVLTEFNRLIGGFTPLAWQRPRDTHEYMKDETKRTFLYSLTAGKKYRLMKPNYAVCNARELGPIFGGGSDLEIVSDCNRFVNNYSHIGHSFEFHGVEDDFYGKKKFTLKDYEVYEVLL